jgi:hypothetical protein
LKRFHNYYRPVATADNTNDENIIGSNLYAMPARWMAFRLMLPARLTRYVTLLDSEGLAGTKDLDWTGGIVCADMTTVSPRRVHRIHLPGGLLRQGVENRSEVNKNRA